MIGIDETIVNRSADTFNGQSKWRSDWNEWEGYRKGMMKEILFSERWLQIGMSS